MAITWSRLWALTADVRSGPPVGLADLVGEDVIDTVEVPPVDPSDPRLGHRAYGADGRVRS
ncbi:hypothetical protein OOJ91_11950 [Micromonospora lupini]|uniref:hypothetical protein n=1 Tax=Micromonospora lupini TaxID=285679 RepID=UPI00224F2FC8|nr:hypothetical protein [Micromonospora lupini]MCX5066590.1 hypothetical protein [Micromonospora lupini]